MLLETLCSIHAAVGDVLCPARRICHQHAQDTVPSPARALHYNLAVKTMVIDAFIRKGEVSKVRSSCWHEPQGTQQCNGVLLASVSPWPTLPALLHPVHS